jgi:hypothetical protein
MNTQLKIIAIAIFTFLLIGPVSGQTTPPATPVPGGFDADTQANALRPEFASDVRDTRPWDRYTIKLVLDPTRQQIAGSQQVAFTNRASEPLNAVYFHLYPNHRDIGGRLDVTSARVDGVPTDSGVENRDTLIRIDLPRPLAGGATTVIDLTFTVRSPRNGSATRYGAFNQEAGVWALANAYPILARYTSASGWDRRPVDSRGDFVVSTTALYDVTIDIPADWALATTGTRVSQQSLADGSRRERIVSGPQREFFITALKGLNQASSVVEGTRITSYYQADDPEAGRRSLAVAEQSLKAFNAAYGPYPFAELEIVQAALTKFLGVEYPGLVLIEQNLYERNGRSLEVTVAHEVAHQWWYGLVGNDAQGEAWLDEGLASFSQITYYRALGQNELAQQELQGFRDSYLSLRRRGLDQPLSRSPGELRGVYVPVVYAKGALFFEALRLNIGDAEFTEFIQAYFATLRYREATGPELLAIAQRTCECDLSSFYRDWVTTAAPVVVP